MALKKGWNQRKVRENALGWYFDRWYIKSPAGNFYQLFRQSDERSSLTSARIWLSQDMTSSYDPKKEDKIEPIPMGEMVPNYGFKDWDLNRILKEIYRLEEDGNYSKQLSADIENYPECKALYSQDKKSVTICTY